MIRCYTTGLRNQNFGYAASIAVVMLVLVMVVAFVFSGRTVTKAA